jgi:hypothetical protein
MPFKPILGIPKRTQSRRSPRKSKKVKVAAVKTRKANTQQLRVLAKARAQRKENIRAGKEGREPRKVRMPRK